MATPVTVTDPPVETVVGQPVDFTIYGRDRAGRTIVDWSVIVPTGAPPVVLTSNGQFHCDKAGSVGTFIYPAYSTNQDGVTSTNVVYQKVIVYPAGQSDPTPVTNTYESQLNKGQANGYLGLDNGGVAVGGQLRNPITVTAAYAALNGDVALVPSGSFTITTPVALAGSQFRIRNAGSGTITVSAASGSITGSATVAAGATGEYLCDGTNWYRM